MTLDGPVDGNRLQKNCHSKERPTPGVKELTGILVPSNISVPPVCSMSRSASRAFPCPSHVSADH